MSLKKLTLEQANNELNTPQAYREFLIELNNAVVELQACQCNKKVTNQVAKTTNKK